MTMTDEKENPLARVDLSRPLSAVQAEIERIYLSHAMTRANGNKTEAARLAGLSVDTMRRKLDNYTVKQVFILT